MNDNEIGSVMRVPSKAPPVYKPGPGNPTAPPVYRPPQAAPRIQLKPETSSGLATRPAPPHVCRPQSGSASRLKGLPGISSPLLSRSALSRSAQAFPRPAIASAIVRGPIPQMKRPTGSGVEMRPGPPAFRPQAAVNGANLPLQRARLSGAPSAQPARQRVGSLPIQRYTHYTGPGFGGAGNLSENQNYFIPDSNQQIIYATAPPLNSAPITTLGSVTSGSKTYAPYKSTLFFKDCLHTAEEIINGRNLEDVTTGLPSSGDFSKVIGTGETFGVSESKNIKAVRNHSLGNNANPGAGQAYLIVNTKWPGGVTSPYHAAAVVAVDGKDRITLEVFADSTPGTVRNQQGTYAMYTTGSGSGDKFHKHWKDRYFGHFSLTTVIEKY